MLAEELGDVPQADKLSVWFRAHSDRTVEAERKRRSGDYYALLSAHFRHYRAGISECRCMASLYEPTWELVVYGVTRQKRAVARRLLTERGIPEVAAWLREPRSETWLEGKKEITVSFSDEGETIIVAETSET
jgi:hypothetical protein